MPTILSFGEALWDFLPEGLFPGGAPTNVAYHLARFGNDARLVTALGQDLLGDELLRRLRHWRLETSLIARHPALPTGTVIAELEPDGDARYQIAAGTAWDHIPATPEALRLAAAADCLVHGSLSLRSAPNRAALESLLTSLRPRALHAFDVNLRPPHDDLDLVRELATRATLLKLNIHEAARLADAGDHEQPGAERDHALALHARHGCPLVLITAGPRGAGLLRAGRHWTWQAGLPTAVVDTVGAGDGFLACFIHHLLAGRCPDDDLLARACRHGEWITTQRGATPPYPPAAP
jgi:fructokinase